MKFLACHLLNTIVDVWKHSSLRVVTKHMILALGRKDKTTSSKGRLFLYAHPWAPAQCQAGLPHPPGKWLPWSCPARWSPPAANPDRLPSLVGPFPAGVSQPVCRPGDSLHRLLPSVALHGEGLQYPPLEDQQHHWLRIFLHLQHPLRQQGLQPLRDRVLEELQVKLQGCLQGGRGEQG